MTTTSVISSQNNSLMQQLLSSKISFGQIETPGWSSIVITKVNTDLLPTKFSSPKILDCLPKTINIDFAEKKYSKIKISLPKPCTHNNVIDDFIHDNHSQKNDQKICSDSRGCFQQQRTLASKVQNYLLKYGTKELTRSSKEQAVYPRFKQISIHEYLYLQKYKLQSKRKLEKILEDDYASKTLLFKPMINKKSSRLAKQFKRQRKEGVSRFAKFKSKHPVSQSHFLERQCKILNNNSGKQENYCARYEILTLLFTLLSNSSNFITKQTLDCVTDLPLPCIESLQRLLILLYTGISLNWLDFLSYFNTNTLQNQQSFFRLLGKYFFLKKTFQVQSAPSQLP